MEKNLYIFNFKKSEKYKFKISYAVIFFSVFFLILGSCEMLNRYVLLDRFKRSDTLDTFQRVKSDVEILFVGDSHMVAAVDTSFFKKKSFNIANAGTSYIQPYYMLKKYISEMPELKAVILQLDLQSFSAYKQEYVEAYIAQNEFIDYAELSKVQRNTLLKRRFKPTVLTTAFGKKVFLINLKNWLLNHSSEQRMFLEGTVAGMSTTSADEGKAFRLANTHFKGQRVFDSTFMLYFKKLLELCKEHELQVITIQLPTTRAYLSSASKYITKKDLFTKVLENSIYCGYIDKNFDYLESFKDQKEYFLPDGDHLNPEGSKLLSQLIADDFNI